MGIVTAVEIKRLVFLLLAITSLRASETCFFIPPKGWEIADPKMLAPSVRICFLGKNSKGLPPTINLATESVDVTLDAYVEEVRKIHRADPNCRWRDLGKFTALMGSGRLMELEIPTELGPARMVQLVVIKDKVAYILTAAALKEEFSKHYKTFDVVLHSLQSTSNLVEAYPSKELKNLVSLQQRVLLVKKQIDELFQKRESFLDFEQFWKPFENKIINDFTEMGPYWQILLLSELRRQLQN